MRSSLDFSSWTSLLSTVLGLLLVTCLMMGIRLLFMQTVQNERLNTLIAAYKTLGSSFTGTLSVSPLHLRELRQNDETPPQPPAGASLNERRRRIRDAVEAALSDIILLGTEEQVELAARAARDMVAGRPIETAALVTSLRGFIRDALDLEPIPSHLQIPSQGPARPNIGGAGGNRKAGEAQGSGGRSGAGAQGASMGAGGLGLGAGLGSGLSTGTGSEDLTDRRS